MKKIAFSSTADLRSKLMNLSAPKLKSIINKGVKDFGLDSSWSAPKTNDQEELVSHLNDLCNEHGVTVDESTLALKKSSSLHSTASDFPPELLEAQKNLNIASSLIARYSATGRDESICKKILNSIDKAQKDLVAVLKEYKND